MIVLKILTTYEYYNYGSTETKVIFPSLYPALSLATTLWCTLLIIYRIWLLLELSMEQVVDWDFITVALKC